MRVGHTNAMMEKRLEVIKFSRDVKQIKRAVKDYGWRWREHVSPFRVKTLEEMGVE